MTTWLLMIVIVAGLGLKRCMSSSEGRFVAVSDTIRDSLLTVAPFGCQHVSYRGFEVWFDTCRHIPACVTYELIKGHLNGVFPRIDRFEADDSIIGCPEPNAYYGTGLHRGHMAPATDMSWDSMAIRQSFLMTNICPQHRSLNEGGWARLEEKCREWVLRDSALIIATGPIIDQGMDTIEGSGVMIPKRFFKVILAHCIRPMRALAFIYDNGPCNGKLKRYVSTVDEVERLTGMDFFKALPDDEEKRIEKACNLQVWLH